MAKVKARNQELEPRVTAGSKLRGKSIIEASRGVHFVAQKLPGTPPGFKSGASREAISPALQGSTSCDICLHRIYVVMHEALSWLQDSGMETSAI